MTDRRTKLAIYGFFVCLYGSSAAGHFFSSDHVAVFMTTESLVERRSLEIKRINDAALGKDVGTTRCLGWASRLPLCRCTCWARRSIVSARRVSSSISWVR